MTRPLRIAIADDESDIRRYFAKCLPRLGHQVVAVAANGRQLVEECHSKHPDLIITDMRMPEMTGLEAAAEVNRHESVPVILVSAYADEDADGPARAEFVLAHLHKPICLAELEPIVAEAARRVTS